MFINIVNTKHEVSLDESSSTVSYVAEGICPSTSYMTAVQLQTLELDARRATAAQTAAALEHPPRPVPSSAAAL